jgi:uncharacterized protein
MPEPVDATSMMCTCCAAPIAVTMRKRRVPVAAVVAFWIGNPALNPAVLAFLVLVLSWKWAALRIVSAIVLLSLVGLVAHLLARPQDDLPVTEIPHQRPANLALTFGRSLVRLCTTLLPEYLAIVLLLMPSAAGCFLSARPWRCWDCWRSSCSRSPACSS